MEKYYFNTENGINYELGEDGFYYPLLALPSEKEDLFFGKFGRLHYTFIKENRKAFYVNLLTSGKLLEYLCEVDRTANEMLDEIVGKMAIAEGCDNGLKVVDQLKWVGLMNNYRNCAQEVVLREIVYR